MGQKASSSPVESESRNTVHQFQNSTELNVKSKKVSDKKIEPTIIIDAINGVC